MVDHCFKQAIHTYLHTYLHTYIHAIFVVFIRVNFEIQRGSSVFLHTRVSIFIPFMIISMPFCYKQEAMYFWIIFFNRLHLWQDVSAILNHQIHSVSKPVWPVWRWRQCFLIGARARPLFSRYCWFSVSRNSKKIKIKKQNRSIDKVQNLGNKRR